MTATLPRPLTLVLLLTLLFSACKKEQPVEPNEEEVITTLLVRLTPAGGGPALEYRFEDADGPGGAAATIDDIILAPATVYDAELILLNKTVSPADTLSNEIAAEADAHRFYFEVEGGAALTLTDFDADDNGIPLGLRSRWTTGAASTGKLQITLRHYPGTPPDKALADGVNDLKSATDLTTKDIGGFTLRIQ